MLRGRFKISAYRDPDDPDTLLAYDGTVAARRDRFGRWSFPVAERPERPAKSYPAPVFPAVRVELETKGRFY